jgi:hypothetical protein
VSKSNKLVQLTVNGRVSQGLTRRRAMQWVMAAVAASAIKPGLGAETDAQRAAKSSRISESPPPEGYGSDPNLLKTYKPGDLWPLTLTPAQRATAVALGDILLPNDQYGPAASELGVIDMLDEWISAPYEAQADDRKPVVFTLDWMAAESTKRFAGSFDKLTGEQQIAICDDICFFDAAKPEFRQAADGFRRIRAICASAYYSTPQGWKAVGYVGNVALESFDGPPEEVLKQLGLTQTVV